MRFGSVFAQIGGVEGGVVEGVSVEDGVVVVHARARGRCRSRCGVCGRRSPGYDQGAGRRCWRSLDLGVTRCSIEADASRVGCAEHGVVVGAVPWARHDAGHTRSFDGTVAWLATQTSKSAACTLMRTGWRTVGAIITRVVADGERVGPDRLDGLRRIGIDEISYRVGQRYLTVVVDHDTGRLVWASEGRDKKTVRRFFDLLGVERASRIEAVTSDLAAWITRQVDESCPNATRCIDPFHVVALATDALDVVRREIWNDLRRGGDKQGARFLKGARFCVWKNPENLTERQQVKLANLQKTNKRLYRAYLLKESLRAVFHADTPDNAIGLLDGWLAWARRCRIASFT